jgi:hypothetical protein
MDVGMVLIIISYLPKNKDLYAVMETRELTVYKRYFNKHKYKLN